MKKVIVIGAGMAGIMATRTLQEANVNVTLLEAADTIGGRTLTKHKLGVSADLGASWIHGPVGNPLTPLADKFGVAYGETDFLNRSGTAVQAYDSDGSPLNMEEYARGQLLGKAALQKTYSSILAKRPSNNSLKALIEECLALPDGLTRSEQLGAYYWAVIRSEYADAADWDTIDWQIGEYSALPGDDLLLYGGGFNGITDRLADGLDIRTGVVVERIVYGKNGVEIGTNVGRFTADHVIITVPLGVLKADAIAFDPPFPEEKQGAIGRIGFGNYEKLWMRFDDFYWPRDRQRFNWLSEARPGEPPLFHAWLNMGYYTGEPVLVSYHAGRRARFVNGLTADEQLSRTLDAMNVLFGDVPRDNVQTVRTDWQNNRFTRGSYSFDQMGQLPEDRRTLAQSVNNQLFFAGEATHPHFYATVHGAYETGIRAAQEIITQ